ncbi:hypothetical protein pb186bvf_002530 [Paramecium bursaria]
MGSHISFNNLKQKKYHYCFFDIIIPFRVVISIHKDLANIKKFMRKPYDQQQIYLSQK